MWINPVMTVIRRDESFNANNILSKNQIYRYTKKAFEKVFIFGI